MKRRKTTTAEDKDVDINVNSESEEEKEDEIEGEIIDNDSPQFIPQATLPKTLLDREKWRRAIVVLVNASLESVKLGNRYELLNSTHKQILSRSGRDPAQFRPDIVHHCLLTLLDSPLNKSAQLQVYVHTSQNLLIEVNPKIRLPRQYSRFSGLMVQLLHKNYIRATLKSEKLLKLIKNPITLHLPPCPRFSLSVTGTLVNLPKFIHTLPNNGHDTVVYFVGAMAHGSIEEITSSWTEKTIAISRYALSGAAALSRLCTAYENEWGVL